MEIGDKIKKIRTDNHLSQEQFAERFGVTRQAVSNWENGRNYPDMDTIAGISDSFNVSFDDLIKGDDDLIHSIDKTRARAGIWKKLFLFILGVLVAFALDYIVPRVVKAMCYDPGEVVFETVYDDGGSVIEEHRLTCDLEVFSTLRMPGHKYDYTNSYDLGMGKYNFTASRSAWIGDTKGESFSGHIERNSLQIYEPDKFRLPSGNVFEWCSSTRDIDRSLEENLRIDQENFKKLPNPDDAELPPTQGMDGSTEESKANLKELSSDRWYEAYVSFNKALTYEEALKWIDKYEGEDLILPWVAVSTSQDIQSGPIGFYTSFSGYMRGFDKDKYPYLFGYEDPRDNYGDDEALRNEDIAGKHLISMLRYLADQKTFCRMLDEAGYNPNFGALDDDDYLNRVIDYIEENGLKIYGVAVTANKKALTNVHEDPNVFSIATEPY